MKRNTRIVALALILCLAVTLVPVAVSIGVSASEGKEDAMTAISEGLGDYVCVETTGLTSDGYIGIPVEYTVLFDTKGGTETATPGYNGTPVIFYVVNANVERVGTDSDVDIIQSMLDRGYAVVVLDYLNDARAISPDLDWSVQKLLTTLRAGGMFGDSAAFPDGSYPESFVVPAGHNLTLGLVFFEYDKHAADGTLEKIVEVWNYDFRGNTKYGEYIIPWVHEDGSRKATQNDIHNGTEPVWYADAEGTVEDAENGTYIKIKHTKAEVITDCVKPDGTPIDLNLYMHVIYPTNPESDVPTMTLSGSSEHLASGASNAQRPHVNGFLFDGYAELMYDYGYVPMARNDHYGYFDGNTSAGHVTGDNMTYAVYTYSSQEISTAAMRYLRYLSLSDHDTYALDLNAIGVVGNSKGSMMTNLAAAELRETATVEEYTDLEAYVEEKITSLQDMYYFVDHHGESRYANGITESYTKDGATIDGGERQPHLTYNGVEIASGANLVYSSCGATPLEIGADSAPLFVSINLGGSELSGYLTSNYLVTIAREFDVPTMFLESMDGHTLIGRSENNWDVDAYQTYKSFVHYFLRHDAVDVAYTETPDGMAGIDTTAEWSVKFTGSVPASEIAKVTVTDSTGAAVTGQWSSLWGDTRWTFTPDMLVGGEKYTVTVPAELCGDNGKAIATAHTYSFITVPEGSTALTLGGNVTLSSTDGSVLALTVPDMATLGDNRFTLRVRVANEAANTLAAYSAASDTDTAGELLTDVALKGAGYYNLDLTDYIEGYAAGEVAYVRLVAEKASGTTTVRDISFDSELGGFTQANVWKAFEAIEGAEGEAAMQINLLPTVRYTDDANDYKHQYYSYSSQVLSYSCLFRELGITRDDYGRRFTVSFRIYDTTSRDLELMLTHCGSDLNTKIGIANNFTTDYEATRMNYRTAANEWITISFDHTIYDTDYGISGLHWKNFYLYVSSDGNTASPIYIDSFTVTEEVTDILLSEAAIITSADGDRAFKQAESENAFAIGDTEYATLSAALAAAKDGDTVKLLRSYTLSKGESNTVPNVSSLTLDLNGYRLDATGAESSVLILSATDAETVAIVIKDGSVLLHDGALIKADAGTSAADGKTYNLFLSDLYVGISDGAMVKKVIAQATAADGVSACANLTLTDCTVDTPNLKFTPNPVSVFAAGSGDFDVNYTVKGGSIGFSSYKKLTLVDSGASLTFAKNADGEYTTVTLPEVTALHTEASFYSDAGYSYLDPAGESANGYTTYSLTQDEGSTIYGVIPDEYLNAEEYPFVIFRNGSFVKAYAVFSDNVDSDGANSVLEYVKNMIPGPASANSTVQVLLRRDYVSENDNGFNNLASIGGTMVLDLGGHTFTNKDKAMFSATTKTSYVSSTTGLVHISNRVLHDSFFVIKNGNIVVDGSSSPIVFSAYQNTEYYKPLAEQGEHKSFYFEMEGVTFSRGANFAASALVATTSTGTSYVADDHSITLTDCTLDLRSNSTLGAVSVLKLGSTANVNVAAQVVGGRIIADSTLADCTLYTVDSGDSVLFSKDLYNEYTDLVYPSTGEPTLDFTVPTAEGDLVYNEKGDAQDSDYVWYLTENPLYTPYGMIPEEYKDAETYPFVIFRDGAFRVAAKYWTNDNSSDGVLYASWGGDIIYLRRDYDNSSDAQYNNYAVNENGTLTLDLNGKTFTAGKYMVDFCGKNSNITLSSVFNVKNGNIVVAGSALFRFAFYAGTPDTANVKSMGVGLENVNVSFKSGSTASSLITSGNGGGGTGGRVAATVTLNGCDVDLTGWAGSSFTLVKMTDPMSGSTVQTTVTGTVAINGGSIKAENGSLVTIFAGDSTDSLTLGKYGDSYPELLFASGLPKTTAYTTAAGSLGYGYYSTSDGYTSYRLGEFTKYGAIPFELSDTEKYPLAVFNGAGMLTLITDVWGNDDFNTTPSALMKAKLLTDSKYSPVILVRDDFVITGGFYNLNQLRYTVTVDLDGHTLSRSDAQSAGSIFYALAKGGGSYDTAATTVVVKNGKILVGEQGQLVHCSVGANSGGNKVFNFTFEGVTVALDEGAAKDYLVTYSSSTAADGINAWTNYTFTDCTFDLTGAPVGATVFGKSVAAVIQTVSVNGCTFIGDNLDEVTLADLDSTSSLVFGKGSTGYSTLSLVAGSPAPTWQVVNAAGVTAGFYYDGTAEGTDTYILLPVRTAGLKPLDNLTLYADIYYNLYLPKNDHILSITVGDESYTDLGALEKRTINGVEYYVLSRRVLVTEALNDVTLTVSISLENGSTAGASWTLGVVDYLERLLADESASDTAIALAKDILSYIRAAYTYAEDADSAAAITAIIGEEWDSESVPVTDVTSEKSLDGFASARLELSDGAAYIFELSGDYDYSAYEFKIRGITYEAEYVSIEGKNCLRLSLPAYLMDETVTYTVSGTDISGCYNLRAYLDFAEGEGNAALTSLVQRLWKYAERAEAYRNEAYS